MLKNPKNTRLGSIGRLLYILAMLWVFGIYPAASALARQPRIPGFYGSASQSLPAVQPNALPQHRHPSIDPGKSGRQAVPGGAAELEYGTGRLDVYQEKDKIILDWNTFNVGEEAETRFHQGGGSALNRIYDQNPSRIYGKLTADGTIYLVNQNGIIFGPDSRTNVRSLIASSLAPEEILDPSGNPADWQDRFAGDDVDGVVSNHGVIQAASGGGIYLIGPEVENFGTLDAPTGQVALAAGNEVEVTPLESSNRVLPFVYVQPGANGKATNSESGRITADSGIAGLYGRVVNQEGYVRSVSAITNNGRIELHASEQVNTGANSITASPISADPEKVHSSFNITGGNIHVAGLDKKVIVQDQETNQTTDTQRIIHNGDMAAPGGDVTLAARDRVYLNTGSRIDVAGGWVAAAADDMVVEAQLNSVELKNDFLQQDGILRGETIRVVPQEGTAIGDLSDSLNNEFLTASEMVTAGGDIRISAPDGDIILRKDARLDFSGGGKVYSSGHYDTTKLVMGNRILDISAASDLFRYDAVANRQEHMRQRWGIKETYEGLYYGGSVPVRNMASSFIEGNDAGRLYLRAKGMVLDGILDGSATAGIYQTDTIVPEEMYANFAVQLADGTRAPRGGELIIGAESPIPVGTQEDDFIVEEVFLSAAAPVLPDDFGPEDPLKSVTQQAEKPFASEFSDSQGPLYRTVLSTKALNGAGLSDLSVYANTRITVEPGAAMALRPGGLRIDESIEYVTGMPLQYLDLAPASLLLQARAVRFGGDVSIPNGDVFVFIRDTVTSTVSNNPPGRQVELRERAFVSPLASIRAAGDRIDNSQSKAVTVAEQGFIDGGNIQIADQSKFGAEVILAPGALLDVSSGYRWNVESFEAGNAGAIDLKGTTLVMGGSLKGHSLPDRSGGSITLHADTVRVTSERSILSSDFTMADDLPASLQDGLILSDGQLDDTGFTHIALKSYADLIVTEGVALAPSLLKLAYPTSAAKQGVISPAVNTNRVQAASNGVGDGADRFITVGLPYLGPSSITAKAGQPLTQSQAVDPIRDTFGLILSEGAGIEVAPGGTIELSGLVTEIAGTLKAPAGEIDIRATGVNRDLAIKRGSAILAGGIARPILGPIASGLPQRYEVLDGGNVTLSANSGNIRMVDGSIVDVSGSKPVSTFFYGRDNLPYRRTVASDAGGLALQYQADLDLQGQIIGNSHLPSSHGAALALVRSNETAGLTVEQNMIDRFRRNGFDAMAFRSLQELRFTGNIDASLARRLILDAPLIAGTDGQKILFDAPAITLANSRGKYGDNFEEISYNALVKDADGLGPGNATVSLSGAFIDIMGGIALSGFKNVSLNATGDMRLTDEVYYNNTGSLIWKGQLRTPGDLSLRASRIYPTTRTAFNLVSENERITILPGAKAGGAPIVSGGGSLTLAAAEIDHRGYLAAPMGSVRFVNDLQTAAPSERILLGSGSVITTAADSRIEYGILDDIFWNVEPKPRVLTSQTKIQTAEVETIPERRIDIDGVEIIMQTGAAIDASGGGSILAFEFIPGAEGLADPFLGEKSYVVVPGVDFPGRAVFLNAGSGLPAGTYSLLPADQHQGYAFLKNAYIINYLGNADTPGAVVRSPEGYPTGIGYERLAGTDFTSATAGIYSVRPASEVFKRGDFNIREIKAGDGGTIDIEGTTTILDGILKGDALAGYIGGRFSISGARSSVVRSVAAVGTDFDFDDIDDIITDELAGTARVLDRALSDRGLREINIGALGITKSITVEKNAVLKTPVITLSADEKIVLERGSGVIAGGPNGSIAINTPDGDFIFQTEAVDPLRLAPARVHATKKVGIRARTIQLNETNGTETVKPGQISSEAGTLTLRSPSIVVVPEDKNPAALPPDLQNGLILTDRLKGYAGFSNVELHAESDISVVTGINLKVLDELSIDAPIIRGYWLDSPSDANSKTVLSSRIIRLANSGAAQASSAPSDQGQFNFLAEDIVLGRGQIQLDGFDAVGLAAANDIKMQGDGALISSGDLTLSAARLATGYYLDAETEFEVADFRVQAGDAEGGYRNIAITPGNGAAGANSSAGGSLEFLGNTIDITGTIATAGGWITFEAKDAAAAGHGIRLLEGARIDVRGTDHFPGGRVILRAEEGAIDIQTDAHVDVSAGEQGDAGTLSLYTPRNIATINGNLTGRGNGGKNGALVMDVGRLDNLQPFLIAGTGGGFTEKLDLRVRSGDIVLEGPDTLRASSVKMVADSGDILLAGTIDASGSDGGSIEIAAGYALMLAAGGEFYAAATAAQGHGGKLYLNSAENQLILSAGSLIEVSGGQAGPGGKVHFRALRTDDNADVRMDLSGTVRGASQMILEGVSYAEDARIDTVDITDFHTRASAFLANAPNMKNRLLQKLTLENTSGGNLRVVPGIEVRNAGNINLAANWDMTALGTGSQGGFVTLRAADDLHITQSMADHPTPLGELNDQMENLPPSWGFNLVAGADLDSSDIMAINTGEGDLTLAKTISVYTENNRIRFASGRDIRIEGAPGYFNNKYMVNYAMEYNIATYSGNIDGKVGRDLIINDGGAVQSATGRINIAAGRDLIMPLSETGGGAAIRTTGTAPPDPTIGGFDWIYSDTHDGGDIRLGVGGDVRAGENILFYRDPSAQNRSTPHLLFWDNMYASSENELYWAADYGTTTAPQSTPTAGIASMGGGSITVTSGKNVSAQIGTFKQGDLAVFAKADAGGYFQVAAGKGAITAGGNIKSSNSEGYDTSLALFDAEATVTAVGNIDFGTVFNPTFPRTFAEYTSLRPPSRNLDYGPSSKVSVTAIEGDFFLSGGFWKIGNLNTAEANAYRVLPPTVNLSSGGQIQIGSEQGGDFVLAPYALGGLNIQANESINGLYRDLNNQLRRATLQMSDVDPVDVYRLDNEQTDPIEFLFIDETQENAHAATPLHKEDVLPVAISAGGNIEELRIISPKQTTIDAGGDIIGLYFFGQNINDSDATTIQSLGNIRLSSATVPAILDTGMRNGGPGLFLVQAGGSVDLGTTQGIQTVGNAFYAALSENDSALAVMAGMYHKTKADELSAFFERLRDFGTKYSRLQSEGNPAEAARVVQQARDELIAPFIAAGVRGDGNIDMTSSSIQSVAEFSDIFIMSTGDVNVGLTAIPDPAELTSGNAQQTDSGIFTSRGGDINVFSGGDLNVNESRVMTFRGGDITAWSDRGDINAGRGSKTAINAGEPRIVSITDEQGIVIGKKIVWEPPSVGSGIRTLTYDPDGFQGPESAPLAGDVFLFAPAGVIDAGEAGIAARNVVLGATEVLNVQNIEVGGTSVGVPVPADAGTLGSITGDTGSLNEAAKIAEKAATMNAAKEQMASQAANLAKKFTLKWLKVEFMGFEGKIEQQKEKNKDGVNPNP